MRTSDSVVVYTAIFGNYDVLRPPGIVDPDVDYVYITDNRSNDNVPPWIVRVLDVKNTDPRKQARRNKIMVYDMFPGAAFTIWHDGSVQLRCKPGELIKLLGDADIAVVKHSLRDCIYDEARECIALGKDRVDTIESQMERYRKAGYPKHNGLHTTFLLVRRNNEAMYRFGEAWWRELNQGSVRDQLSFDYVCWKRGITPVTIPGDIHSGKCYGRTEIHGGR